ncbi:MAG: crossover junction endodeoxyribonuclease RuvC [Clostridiales bacterium]|nr:crossover junction endodeoxyribonuclease RuvC [Clostridiales bacterium]
MIILGIDPGVAIVGYGLIEAERGKIRMIDCGAITTPAGLEIEDRLLTIYNDLNEIIDEYQPSEISIEELFFNTNQTTAIGVAEARGVILLAAKQKMVDIYEYTPLQVKQTIVGYGRAQKKQVQIMVKNILKLDAVPKPDDAADALALAICHNNCRGSKIKDFYNGRKVKLT